MLIVPARSEGSGEFAHTCRLVRAFDARMQEVLALIDVQTKSITVRFAGYVSMGVYLKHLRIYDTYQNLIHWPI